MHAGLHYFLLLPLMKLLNQTQTAQHTMPVPLLNPEIISTHHLSSTHSSPSLQANHPWLRIIYLRAHTEEFARAALHSQDTHICGQQHPSGALHMAQGQAVRGRPPRHVQGVWISPGGPSQAAPLPRLRLSSRQSAHATAALSAE